MRYEYVLERIKRALNEAKNEKEYFIAFGRYLGALELLRESEAIFDDEYTSYRFEFNLYAATVYNREFPPR